jgi:hypothetical protein
MGQFSDSTAKEYTKEQSINKIIDEGNATIWS